MLCIIILISFLLPALTVATIPKAADLVAELEKTVRHIELPRSALTKFVGMIGNKPARFIKSFHAPNFHIQGFEVRFSEAFIKAHILGAPPGSYDKNFLVTNLGKVSMKLPMSQQAWAYGATKTLETTSEVELTKTVWSASKGAWQKPKRTLGLIQFKATKYEGLKTQKSPEMCWLVGLCTAHPMVDVLVIEDITKLEETFYKHLRPSLAPPVPFSLGRKASVNVAVPQMFIHHDFEIIAPRSLVGTGINFDDTMTIISGSRVKFYAPDDFSIWKMWERRTLNSNGYVDLEVYKRSSSESEWILHKNIRRGIQVTGTRGKVKESGKNAILIDNLVILKGPPFNTFKKHIINRPPILSEPQVFNGLRTWAVPSIVHMEGVEVRLTEQLLLENYYLATGSIKPDFSYVYTLPDKPLTLSLSKENEFIPLMKAGALKEVAVQERADLGIYYRDRAHQNEFVFRGQIDGKVVFEAFKEFNPDTLDRVLILTKVYDII